MRLSVHDLVSGTLFPDRTMKTAFIPGAFPAEPTTIIRQSYK